MPSGTFLVRPEDCGAVNPSVALFDTLSAAIPVAGLVASEASSLWSCSKGSSAEIASKSVALGNVNSVPSHSLLLVKLVKELDGMAVGALDHGLSCVDIIG